MSGISILMRGCLEWWAAILWEICLDWLNAFYHPLGEAGAVDTEGWEDGEEMERKKKEEVSSLFCLVLFKVDMVFNLLFLITTEAIDDRNPPLSSPCFSIKPAGNISFWCTLNELMTVVKKWNPVTAQLSSLHRPRLHGDVVQDPSIILIALWCMWCFSWEFNSRAMWSLGLMERCKCNCKHRFLRSRLCGAVWDSQFFEYSASFYGILGAGPIFFFAFCSNVCFFRIAIVG